MQLTQEEANYLMEQLKKNIETTTVIDEKTKVALGLVGL